MSVSIIERRLPISAVFTRLSCTVRLGAIAVLTCVTLALPGAFAPIALAETSLTQDTSLFDIYAANRRDGIPSYVTADLLLVTYSLARQAQLLDQERAMSARLASLAQGLSAGVATEPEDPAGLANRDLAAILVALSQNKDRLENSGDPARAQAELDRILASDGIAVSPLWGWPLDYSQFRPRGPYAEDPTLAGYFRTLRYASLVLFPTLASEATGVSAEEADRALLQARRLSEHLRANEALRADAAAIDTLYRWQFGAGEDLSLEDLLAAPEGKPADMRQWLFERARATGRQPRILAGLVDDAKLESGRTPADVLTGFRLLPARYSADSAAIQRLVYDQVGAYQGDPALTPFGLGVINGQSVKAYPSVDELLALLGSRSAADHIASSGQTAFAGYSTAAEEARQRLAEADGLLAHHLELMRTALADTDGMPSEVPETQMKAFWTWQRYLGLLHSKPSYTVGSKGYSRPPSRAQAWLEPSVKLYRALAETVDAHRAHAASPVWDQLAGHLKNLIRIAEQEQATGTLQAADMDYLNSLDLELADLVSGEKDRPIVVDVHSVPALGRIVVEGIGWPQPVTQVLSDGAMARGARLSHHERKWPLSPRPTDAEWVAWLEKQVAEETEVPASATLPAEAMDQAEGVGPTPPAKAAPEATGGEATAPAVNGTPEESP